LIRAPFLTSLTSLNLYLPSRLILLTECHLGSKRGIMSKELLSLQCRSFWLY